MNGGHLAGMQLAATSPRELRTTQEKIKEGGQESGHYISTELQTPNTEAEVYNNNKKCD